MEILIGIMLGLFITLIGVFFYCLGISHGRAVKDGATVKLEPVKAITRKMKQVAKEKETEKKQDEFTLQINELFNYNGRKVAK